MSLHSRRVAPTSAYELPFFSVEHRELAQRLGPWAAAQTIDESEDRAACKAWVAALGQAGFLRYCVAQEDGGALPTLDSRALVVLREMLAFYSPLADFAFAMQGLGSGAISLAGTTAQRARYLPSVANGKLISAFALSEPQAGSDAGALATRAQESLSEVVLNGTKTWISNGGMADFYCVFAKTSPDLGTRGITAYLVDANTPGLDASEFIEVMAPHPLATLKFENCRIAASAQLGERDKGFKLAMQTLDIFRASVAAAALGMARRALVEAVSYSRQRRMFGQTLADFQMTQSKLGEMAALIDAGALLTYRAAWMRDVQGVRTTSQAAMAKLTATEHAQKVIDMALQMHGGLGVRKGEVLEHLYRDIRALRIYEGASEVQQLIIGKAQLSGE
jgi:acyl-CoA dehydrogenase